MFCEEGVVIVLARVLGEDDMSVGVTAGLWVLNIQDIPSQSP